MSSLSDRLKLARSRYGDGVGITQEDLAYKSGVSRAAVQQWERGDVVPRGKGLSAVANVLGVSPAWLLHGDDASPRPVEVPTPTHDNASASDDVEPGVVALLADPDLLAKRGISQEVQGALTTLRTGRIKTKHQALTIALALESPDA